VLVLVFGLILALRGCRKKPRTKTKPDPTTQVPKIEPGTWDLVLPDKTRHRVRLLGWEGSEARVLDLSDNKEKVIEMLPGMVLEPPAAAAKRTSDGAGK